MRLSKEVKLELFVVTWAPGEWSGGDEVVTWALG